MKKQIVTARQWLSSFSWRKILSKVVTQADGNKVRRDVEDILENPADLEVLTKENVVRLLM